ncbi:aminopeptidase, partial [Enterococcus faecium]|uniref:aminopeptidase n=1 Tax=Enterococcus faecium TaxID=1352 RepID=UPI003CC5CA0F
LSDLNELLKKYARLIAETVVATEKGHTVVFQISVEQAPLARLITHEAYKLGAAVVIVKRTDDQIQRVFLLHAATDRIE